MTSRPTRSIVALCVALSAVAACSSDDTSGSVLSSGAVSTPQVTDEAPVETDAPPVTAAVTTPDSAATVEDTAVDATTAADDTVVENTVENTTTADTTGSTDAVGARVDDTPVCMAFSRFVTTSFFVGFAGIGDQTSTSGIERIEVVAYSSLGPDVATLRQDVPAELLVGLEPLFTRIDAAPGALAAGGFDAAEIATIASAWNAVLDAVSAGESVADIPDATEALDPTRLDAAEVAFEAAVGTFADYTTAATGSDELDAKGNAWLAENCPILASSLDN